MAWQSYWRGRCLAASGPGCPPVLHPDASRFEALDGAYRLALVDDTHIVALQQAGLHVVDLTEE